ncbi:MAG: AAA family ATPase [Erysipelothrix sp.]|nr:AAA family ATPase [Erysipelothrix sp.]
MKIKKISIFNYRNLDQLTIHFHENINFIVGENNLGKTNLLELLHILFNRRNFSESDFKAIDSEIKIEVELRLDEGELGIFDDYFSVEEQKNLNIININFIQEAVDENIRYFIKPTNDELFRNKVRNAHFLSYGSIRKPEQELSFSTKNNFLNLLIKRYIDENDGSFEIDIDSLEPLLVRINEQLGKIKTFNLFEIEAKADNDIANLLGNIIQLQTKNDFTISELGEGTRFINSIPLILLNQIAKILENEFTGSVIEVNGKRKLYVIIAVDEPELHLHPHSQRFFINYVQEILLGKNDAFNELLKVMFDVDEINGQLLAVTHSPYIILDDYKHIVRVYDNNGKVNALSGSTIDIDRSLLTHLFRYLDEIKEAFYAKKVLIVEGITEQGAMKALFEKENININLEGISIVNGHGRDNIPSIINLFQKFKIPVVGFIDEDENNSEQSKFNKYENIFYTDLKEFEYDIVECLSLDGYLDYLKELNLNIVSNTISVYKKHDSDCNPEDTEDYELRIRDLDSKDKKSIMNELKEKIIKSLTGNKSFINGYLISKFATTTPPSIKKAIDFLVSTDE